MKSNVVCSILLVMLSSSFCFSQEVIDGPYHIGFEYYKTFDETRKYTLDKDTISRPMLIHFWYPADEDANQGSYYFKNYIDLISIREDFNKATSEIDENSYNFINAYAGFAKKHYGLDTSITTQKILDCAVAAQYGVDISKSNKEFPLIIYAPPNSKSSIQNHMICEYLASHGFMVISVGSAGNESIHRRNDPESIMAQMLDMEYMLSYFEDSLKIKYNGLGLIGFSTGSLANSIFQMRNKNVKAVFSMDGSQEYGHYLSLFNCNDFDLSKTNVPYCLMINNFENFSVYPFYNSILSKAKYIFRMPSLGHNGFVSFWSFFNGCSSNSNGNPISAGYDCINNAALAFFNYYLKTKPGANKNSKLIIQSNEYIESISIDNSMIAQVGNIMLSEGMGSAKAYFNDNQQAFTLKENEINILSRLFIDADIETSKQLLLLNLEMHLDSWRTLLELAKTYKINEELSLAKETILKAQELNPEDSEIISFLNELNE